MSLPAPVSLRLAISIAVTSCSSSTKPEPSNAPQTAATPSASSASDAAIATDGKHPRIFPWASWRERNEKWLASPSDDHCDPRNDHLPVKGESECYPPINVQLAVIVTGAKFRDHDKTMELTLDRGYLASVSTDYFVSLLDAEGRPATRWVHPTRVDKSASTIIIPYPRGLDLNPGVSHAAIVGALTDDNRFPEDDPRSAR